MECRNFYVGDGEHQSPVAGVPSHSSHEIWLIRRNGAHYLSIFRRPLAEALVRGGAVSGVKAIASAMRAFRALRRLPRRVASLNRCKFGAALGFPGVSLCGCDLLVDGVWVGLSVFDSVEVLAVELGERRAV